MSVRPLVCYFIAASDILFTNRASYSASLNLLGEQPPHRPPRLSATANNTHPIDSNGSYTESESQGMSGKVRETCNGWGEIALSYCRSGKIKENVIFDHREIICLL